MSSSGIVAPPGGSRNRGAQKEAQPPDRLDSSPRALRAASTLSR